MGALLKANPSAALVLLEAQCAIFEKHCAIDECQQCAPRLLAAVRQHGLLRPRWLR